MPPTFRDTEGGRNIRSIFRLRIGVRRGMRQSAGMMINYRYDLARIDANHEAYRATGKRALSSPMKSLLND